MYTTWLSYSNTTICQISYAYVKEQRRSCHEYIHDENKIPMPDIV